MATPTSMSPVQKCAECGFDFPLARPDCPHCARPSLFPNVKLAQQTQETDKLEKRYKAALADAASRGCSSIADEFDTECKSSSAICRYPVERLHRHIASGTDLFAGYYELEQLRLRMSAPSGFDWERLRPQAEIELLGNSAHINENQIHYACLSIDGEGLNTYGDCILQLSEPMIAHRASCFDGNTAVIFAIEHTFEGRLRSDWPNRHRICVATMAGQLNSSIGPSDLPGILAAPDPGGDAANDSFIEVHIFGSLTTMAFELVTFVTAGHNKHKNVYREVVEAKLASVGVPHTTR